MLNKILIFLAIATGTNARVAERECQTANNETGTCVKLRECSNLFKILQKGHQPNELEVYITNSKCNADYTEEEYICCAEHYRPKSLTTFNSIDLLPKPPDCGVQRVAHFVYGFDKTTEIDEYPWIVQLRLHNGSYICGGSLINERYVLTAAHCAVFDDLDRVRLGEWDMSVDPDCNATGFCYSNYLEIGISTITIPSSYTSSHKPDIALLRLKRNVFPRINIKPVCLPLVNSLSDNQLIIKLVTTIGWGLNKTGYLNNRRLQADLIIRDRDVCNQKYRRTKMNNKLGTDQLCAGGVHGIDTCDGDPGGPMMYATFTEKPQRIINYLLGVKSYGPEKCGQKDWPAVYTHVGTQISWILDTIEP